MTYLSLDSLAEGIGASQVLAYVERLAAIGVEVELHSFEKGDPDVALRTRLDDAGVRWLWHSFGRRGALGGLDRVARAALAVRGSSIVHARSDLAAAAAVLARSRPWIWDMRSFWRDERIEMGALRVGSVQERLMRAVERTAARRSSGIITLAAAAIPELERRHGPTAAAKAEVITTCVELGRFEVTPLPAGPPVLCLLGTINRAYDVPLIAALVERAQERWAAELRVYAPGPSPWDDMLDPLAGERRSLPFDEVPAALANCHVGLSPWRTDMGVGLLGAMPTKIGEFFATGRPVVVNAGLGDMDDIIAMFDCGAVVRGTAPAQLDAALDEVERLLADASTPARCRSAAEAHFSLEDGVDRLHRLYRRVSDAPSNP